jgi:hypothetical protein
LYKIDKVVVVKKESHGFGNLEQFDPVGRGTEQHDGRVARKWNLSDSRPIQFFFIGVVQK